MNKLIVPMSSSGHCPKALSLGYLNVSGKERPSFLETAAEEGNLHEDALKSKLRNDGYIIEDNREECKICKSRYGAGRKGIHVEIEKENFILVGHIDGKITGNMNDNPTRFEKKLLECKSMSQNEFYRWQRDGFVGFPGYACQLTCYMTATQIYDALYVVKNRNTGYTEKISIDGTPASFTEICEKLESVAEHVKLNKFCPAEYDINSIECSRCSYDNFCMPEPKVIDIDTLKQLEENLLRREELKSTISDAYEKVNVIEESIKKYLRDSGLKQKRFGYIMSLSTNSVTTTYPKENLLAVGISPDQLELAKKVSEPSDRLWIRKVAEK